MAHCKMQPISIGNKTDIKIQHRNAQDYDLIVLHVLIVIELGYREVV